MARVKVGETDVLTVKGRKVSGISFRPTLYAAVANTAIVFADFLGMQVSVKVMLKRGGQEIRILEMPLLLAAMSSMFGKSGFRYVSPGGVAGKILLAAASGVKEIRFIPITVDFGGVIDLHGGDELEITVTSQGNEYSSAIDTSLSFVQYDYKEASGVEIATPKIEVVSVGSGESDKEYEGGDGVHEILFLNTDKTSVLTASNVVTGVSFASDQVNASDTWTEAYTKTVYDLCGDDETYVLQSLRLAKASPGTLLHDCKVGLSFVSANVNGGKNFIIKKRFVGSPNIAIRSAEQNQKMVVKTKGILTAQAGGIRRG